MPTRIEGQTGGARPVLSRWAVKHADDEENVVGRKNEVVGERGVPAKLIGNAGDGPYREYQQSRASRQDEDREEHVEQHLVLQRPGDRQDRHVGHREEQQRAGQRAGRRLVAVPECWGEEIGGDHAGEHDPVEGVDARNAADEEPPGVPGSSRPS